MHCSSLYKLTSAKLHKVQRLMTMNEIIHDYLVSEAKNIA